MVHICCSCIYEGWNSVCKVNPEWDCQVPFGKLLIMKSLRSSILGSGHSVTVGCIQLAVDLILLCWLVLGIGRKPLIKPALLISHLKFSIEDCIPSLLLGCWGVLLDVIKHPKLCWVKVSCRTAIPSSACSGEAWVWPCYQQNAGPALGQYCDYQEVTHLSFLCASMATWTHKWRNTAVLG